MSSVSETTMASLAGALVVTHLEIQLTLAGAELLVREGSLILIRHFRS
jgi:hypothetical protein